MIAKELVEARPKLIAGALVSVATAASSAAAYAWVETWSWGARYTLVPALAQGELRMLDSFVTTTWAQWFTFAGGLVLGLLAAVLGAGMVSGELEGGTMSFLLSRPMSRGRVLATKYAMGAGALLAFASLGSLSILVVARAMEDILNLAGLLVSTALLWLGALHVLGLALLLSVVLDDAQRSMGAAALVVVLYFAVPQIVPGSSAWVPPAYWSDIDAFLRGAFPLDKFLVCAVAALAPLAVAFAAFEHREY
jgi:ABC-type transport system involved in multi-copper enzyme maturation permease subunit